MDYQKNATYLQILKFIGGLESFLKGISGVVTAHLWQFALLFMSDCET